MAKHVYGQLMVGFVAVVTVLMLGALPSYAWTRGGSWHGGGFHSGGFHGGFHHVGFHHGGFHHGFHHFHHGFHHHRFRSRVFIGVGVGVPLLYPYPYPYSPPVVVESAPPVYVQPQLQYWYYCQGAQAYYPYVKECPGGWLRVVPQPSPPPPVSG